ncbi:MAG TPA: NADH-ubiquinone oxidoreductase-F iron-sulfur binding region domain-containing protein [Burkholderiaceae bacterium]|nr:NADH-ubiquinone oxidoreductase-F iron-sulfur binding region domain-containing protein [Burkholderiaceae bacterium]
MGSTHITPDQLRDSIRRKNKSSQLKGRQVDALSSTEVQNVLGEKPAAGFRRDLLIEYLHLLNDHYRGLHERHLVALASAMNMPMAEVYEVASFYHHFEVIQAVELDGITKDGDVPALNIRVCDGLSCELAGAQSIITQLAAILDNPSIRVIPSPCMGRCEQAPVAMVHQLAVANANANLVKTCIEEQKYITNQAVCGINTAYTAIKNIAFLGFDDYLSQGGYALASSIASGNLAAEDVLKTMEDSGLRGLGGAGFPAGRKWRIVRAETNPKLMAINIDEGEPGTFKDRTYLESDPHRFIEGMLIAALVVGIDACYIYLRDEYHDCRQILSAELAKLQANPPASLKGKIPRIELRRGAGAYICGEESAMIESIEGKRGEPRMRPPYIAQVGLFGCPTLEHNFETLYWVRDIVQKGADWFNSFGRHGRKGLRSFSVSGRVKKPGVKLAPAGITLQELLDEYCGGMLDGHQLYAYLPGGASGGILPASLANVPLDFDTLQQYGGFIGSASVIVLSQMDKARDAALNMMRFFANESCGQCTPCRVGTAKAAKLMAAPVWDNATLEDLNKVMADASICGLGQAAPNPVRCVQTYFAHEIGGAQ